MSSPQLFPHKQKDSLEISGVVTNVQRFSIHDGPGIRTTIFLKGCNLRCFWCHNPETWRSQPEIELYPDRCLGCGECLKICPNEVHQLVNGKHILQRERCVGCGLCAENCFAQALVLVGEKKTVQEVMDEILQDRPFYENSKGGVTLSGGEPLLQLEFSRAILQRCQEEGIHTAIETAANVSWDRLAAILPFVDLVMMDIKIMDSAKHQEYTGVPNERILANAQRLSEQPQPLIIRTPIIPGVNDSPAEVKAIAHFISSFPNLLYYELLPFHPMAKSKYQSLDLNYKAQNLRPPSKEKMDTLTQAALDCGVPARHN